MERFKNFLGDKLEGLEGFNYEDYQAKDINEPVRWRDKLNVRHDMDIVELMENLGNCFASLNSFEVDPDHPG
jgi:hypothetical protein